MVRYELPNGKTVALSLEKFLDLTDDDIQYLMSIDAGIEITDPFAFRDKGVPLEEEAYYDELPLEDIPEDEIEKIKKEFEDE